MFYDVVIVGAGTAGSVLASRLSEDPGTTVCLLEAGEASSDPAIRDPAMWPALQGTSIDWQYTTVEQSGTAQRTHAWARGRVLGGSSCLNAMAHVRGHRADFDRWRDAGCAGWGYADLMPYFVRSETSPFGASPYHGERGPIRLLTPRDPHPITRCFLEAGAELGFEPTAEHNGARMTGPALNTLTIVDGRRQSVADAYLTPALARANLEVRTGCLVGSLVFASGERCVGVEVERDGRRETVSAARQVVVCAGTIGSPALLMRSGIGAGEELRALGLPVRVDLAGVGANLHDHLLGAGNVYRAPRPVPPSNYQHSESLLYVPGADPARAPETVVACVVVPVATECFDAPTAPAFTLMFGFTHPHSRGRLRLTCADPRAAPAIDPNYLADARDRDAFVRALDTARRIGATRAMREWCASELLPGGDVTDDDQKHAFLARAATTHHHPVGTCAMGTDARSVVAPSLGVHGTRGLYVVDASVVPSITTGPVNAAVVAIAERAGDLLAGRQPLAPFDPARSA